jgi:hypothetical protein
MRAKIQALFNKALTMNGNNFLNHVKDLQVEVMNNNYKWFTEAEKAKLKNKNLAVIKGLTGFLNHMVKEQYIPIASKEMQKHFLHQGLLPLIEKIICYFSLINYWEFSHVIQNTNLAVISLVEKNY